MPEKFILNLEKAAKNIQSADHLIYITYNLLKEKKILINALEKIYEAIIQIINAILQYDYMWKRIRLYSDPKDNFDIFAKKCAERYNITQEEIQQILNLFKLIEIHKKCPIEFLRREKIVLMSEDMNTLVIDAENIKNYIMLAKRLIQKAKIFIKSP